MSASSLELIMMDESTAEPHVLIFPFPLQGHVNSMLKLAELLCLAGLHITFLVSKNFHRRLLSYNDVESRFAAYSGFRFETLPDGIYDDNPHNGDRLVMLYDSLKDVGKPFLRELLVRDHRQGGGTRPSVSCIIADGILSFAIDIAEELGLSIIYFRTISACAFWAYFSIPQLVKAGELPFQGRDMDEPVANVKGMQNFLRRRDLPSFCRASDMSDTIFNMLLSETQQTTRAKALILNTFEDLEGPILSQIRTCCPNVYTVGPLHAHLKSRKAAKSSSSSSAPSSNSLWQEDSNCITWLDKQPSKSVIYVSFGSITILSRDQLLEFWHGITNSGVPFLWVIRPESIIGKEEASHLPAELLEATEARGYTVGWAPQEQVLAHPSTGGFLTHSGWNSILESIVEGVPMICWSYFADQPVNSRFVDEAWKLGLDIKDTCDRAIVEKVIRELMVVRKDEYQERANIMARMAKDSIGERGSSSNSLNTLIQSINSMAKP